MPAYSKAQLQRLQRAADAAYARIEKALAHDPELIKATDDGFSDYVARTQGSLLDLSSIIAEKLAQ